MVTFAAGYARNLEDTVTIHSNTVIAAKEVFAASAPPKALSSCAKWLVREAKRPRRRRTPCNLTAPQTRKGVRCSAASPFPRRPSPRHPRDGHLRRRQRAQDGRHSNDSQQHRDGGQGSVRSVATPKSTVILSRVVGSRSEATAASKDPVQPDRTRDAERNSLPSGVSFSASPKPAASP